MVGGSGNFTSYKNKIQDNTSTGYYLNLSPNVGYFIVDNFSIGSIVPFYFDNASGPNNSNLNYGLAPFFRYYFRKSDKIINPFFQASYGFIRSKIIAERGYNTASEYRLRGGTALFLNSSVAFEITVEYNAAIKNVNNFQYNNIVAGIGFQIHLEKE